MTLDDAISTIDAQREQIAALLRKITELEARLKTGSSNSSKPPSSDGYRKPPAKDRGLRTRSGKKPGGQPGHDGSTLAMSTTPSDVVFHSPDICVHCGLLLNAEGGHVVERRQVVDIPKPQPVEVVEHRVEVKVCPHCGMRTRAEFPEGVAAPVQYGPRINAFVTNLACYQMIPVARCVELVESVFGIGISTGTVIKMLFGCHRLLGSWEETVRKWLIASGIVHFDETGMRVEGKLHWLHTAGTESLTLQVLHRKRGKEGFDALGVISTFKGIAVHDFWKVYLQYLGCLHQSCCAHLMRELKCFRDLHEGQTWAAYMLATFKKAKKLYDKARAKRLDRVPSGDILLMEAAYAEALKRAFRENPGKGDFRGCRKAFNLAERLRVHHDEILGFLYDTSRPFDNNLAERDVRMAKVKAKVSGCFRSLEGGQAFARIRSYISTARKNGLDALKALDMVFEGTPFLPAMQV